MNKVNIETRIHVMLELYNNTIGVIQALKDQNNIRAKEIIMLNRRLNE